MKTAVTVPVSIDWKMSRLMVSRVERKTVRCRVRASWGARSVNLPDMNGFFD